MLNIFEAQQIYNLEQEEMERKMKHFHSPEHLSKEKTSISKRKYFSFKRLKFVYS